MRTLERKSLALGLCQNAFEAACLFSRALVGIRVEVLTVIRLEHRTNLIAEHSRNCARALGQEVAKHPGGREPRCSIQDEA
jgi:hypothetical protein